ncbi:MAG: 2,3-bisphosphoglycerate-independent phosphoglycerate mutase [Desulfocurvibacter africanus]
MQTIKPTILLILDGWGCAEKGPGNAVCMAGTPTLDRLRATYPSTLLACSGRAVGLPDGFMGNSEVGHMNIGAGRVIYQDMTRIDVTIEDGGFFENPALTQAAHLAKTSGGRLHLMGLVSDGGVHSHEKHIFALLELAKRQGLDNVLVHAFLDGRDTPPTSGAGYVRHLMAKMKEIGIGRVASVIGRYWAMDRDKRWERNELAYDALTLGLGQKIVDPVEAIEEAYVAGENDEFVKPRVVVDVNGAPLGTLQDGDVVIFFNFRADRARQITRALHDAEFKGFARKSWPKLAMLATMTEYDSDFPLPAAYPPQAVDKSLGQIVSEAGLKQLRLAETEKYAHVTYFLSCGREEPFPGEDRLLVPSPRDVATYDLKPEMSVRQVTDILLAKWRDYDLTVCNLANLDMVGHTGIIPAAMEAAKAVDECVARIVEAVLVSGGRICITADHGNAEEMLDEKGGKQTAHSKNPVPFVYIEQGVELASGNVALRQGGILGDIAPTLLMLMGLPIPVQMTGVPLIIVNEGAGHAK